MTIHFLKKFVLLLVLPVFFACSQSPDNPVQSRPPGPQAQDEDHGRPVEAIARDLSVTPEQFREAFKKVTPAPRGQTPSREQREYNRKVLSEALGVDPEKLDEVMDKYRPEGKTSGPKPPPR